MRTQIRVAGDIHAGSSLAVFPPSYTLDDGGVQLPSRAQAWLWTRWLDFWERCEALARRDGVDERMLVLNGDLVEGNHHGSTQLLGNPADQQALAQEILGIPKALEHDATFVVRGTEAHVGRSGSAEEGLARWLDAEPDPDTGKKSWWHLRMEVQGVLLSFAHHGKIGRLPWTKTNGVQSLAAEIFYEHASRGEPHPRLAVRSHFHTHADSHDAHPVRVIQMPAWQLHTAHAHKVVTEKLADIGGIVILIEDGRVERVDKILYTPGRGSVWTRR